MLDSSDLALKAISAIIAAIGAIYVYFQYNRAQLWKARDLAADLVKRLEEDDEIRLVCRSLDWGTGPLLVPKRYKPLFRVDDRGFPLSGIGDDVGDVMIHNRTALYNAMRPRLQKETLKDPRGLVYRACFDTLFSHLNNVNRLRIDEQVKTDDLHELKYWLRAVQSYSYAPEGVCREHTFQPFLIAFDYDGVAELGIALGIVAWITEIPESAERAASDEPSS